MSHKNFGFAKTIISNKLTNEFLNEGEVKSKDFATKFLTVIKESNLLQQEFKIFENIENKHISNDSLATRYIDDNLKLFSKFTRTEIIKEHEKLDQFIDESFIDIDPKKKKLYEALNTLLFESANQFDESNVDLVHESYETIVEYLKENITINETDKFVLLEENIDLNDVVKISIEKFDKKYSSLNENQRLLLKKLVYGDNASKKDLFESLKKENLDLLSNVEKNGIEDKINESIDKISKMNFIEENLVKDVVNLYDLKTSLS